MAPVRPMSSSADSIDAASMQMEDLRTKYWATSTESLTRFKPSDEDAEAVGNRKVEARMEDIALKALHVDDDPSLNPWTVRMFIIGVLISDCKSWSAIC